MNLERNDVCLNQPILSSREAVYACYKSPFHFHIDFILGSGKK